MGLASKTLTLFSFVSIHANILLLYTSLLHSECITTATTTATAKFDGAEKDRSSLLDIKSKITYDPLQVTSSWNDSVHFCKWQGVTCGRRHRRVTVLDLQSRGLMGYLSPAIGNLTFLVNVNLQNNSFRGEIPNEVGHLFRLRVFNLGNNSFEEEIPVNLSRCSNMRKLTLTYNKLVGKIPVELGSLSRLTVLHFGSNRLTGEIPPSFGNLSSIVLFALWDNNLGGSIPDSLGRMKGLIAFSISLNMFSGMIPHSLYNISSIQILSVSVNNLYGSLPPGIGLTLPNLQQLFIGINQFSGPIPVSLFNATRLQIVDMVQNNFTGQVPINVGNLKSLQWLNIGLNRLGSRKGDDLSFLTALTNCSYLRLLEITLNDFGGMLPNSITNLSNQLSNLHLGYNSIYGSIPQGIENLRSLISLTMDTNILTGDIPITIGMLQKLQKISLTGNMFSRQIPHSLGNLSLLYFLDLSNNILNGSIPSSLGNCQFLQNLDLSGNNLSDPIPEKVISGPSSSLLLLLLANNSLTGPLPLEVGDLKNLLALNVSNNKISGEIPSTLGSCMSLEYIHMEGNFFQGSIPVFFSSLKNLRDLDLSHNNFSGQIPKVLANLSSLQNLNLSFNSLEGEVPKEGIFKNKSAISIAGNKNLCGGTPELQLPACPIKKSNKHGRSMAFKVIIMIVCVTLSLALATSFLTIYWRRKTTKTPSPATSLGDGHIRVSYDDLLKATGGFASANLVGFGRFGSVYKGILHHEELSVAVKVLNLQEQGASKSFMAECEALREIRHRNLLKIITSCSSVDFEGNDFKALVFEFMPNASLENWLHPSTDGQHLLKNLNFSQRLNIAIDVASALDYLHHHCHIPIVHSDLKPSNILLDDDMTAHVGDFGLAKFLSKHTNYSGKNETSSIAIKGSIGYVPPEYGMGGKVSTQGDVYSYGILLLEMFTGKRPTDDLFKDGMSIHNLSKIALPERVIEIVDACLLSEEQDESITNIENHSNRRGRIQECLVLIVGIGVACSTESPGERMNMKDVITELHVVKKVFIGPGIQGRR